MTLPCLDKATLVRLVKYGCVGGASAIIDAGVFWILNHFGLVPALATAVSYACSFFVNYRGNRDITFKAGRVHGALPRYVLLVLFNWGLSIGSVAALSATGLMPIVAKLISIVLIACFNYFAMRHFVFRTSGPATPATLMPSIQRRTASDVLDAAASTTPSPTAERTPAMTSHTPASPTTSSTPRHANKARPYGRIAAGRAAYARFFTPRADGAPSWRALWLFPLAVLIALIAVSAFGLNGSSSGYDYKAIHGHDDPAIILGHTRSIRSDEFLVQTPQIISQDAKGYPVANNSEPGGIDMELNWEAPYKSWSVLFRPNLFPFLFLPFDQAYAWRWYLPDAAIVVACYLFCVLLLPKRPGFAALTAITLVFNPFIQWWYLPNDVMPIAWGFAILAGLLGLGFAQRWWSKALIVAAITYVSAWTVMGLYVPFIIATAVPCAAFIVGWLCHHQAQVPFKRRLAALGFFGIGAGIAGAITGLFLLTQLHAVKATAATVYPGQRLTTPGQGSAAGASGSRVVDGLFSALLYDDNATTHLTAGNQSESSAFLLTAFLLLPLAIWCIWLWWRKYHHVNAILIASVIGPLIIALYMYVPGWEPLAKFLLLTRVPWNRAQPGLGVGAVIFLAVLVHALQQLKPGTIRWPLTAISVVGLAAYGWWYREELARVGGPSVGIVSVTGIVFLLSAIGLCLIGNRRPAAGAAAWLVVAVILGAAVNPVRVGVFDWRTTAYGKEIVKLNQRAPGRWIAIDGVSKSLIMESDVPGFSTVQGFPNTTAWHQLDPSGQYEQQWNRYAHVTWTSSPTAQRIHSNTVDTVQIRFEPCDAYEQAHIKYAVADHALSSQCLKPVGTATEKYTTFYYYQVVAPATVAKTTESPRVWWRVF
jgi:putative flippase GtrA